MIFKNVAWLLFDKLFKIIFSFFIVALVARHLGVEQFGLFNYISTIVLFFIAVSSFGFNGTVVRELANEENKIKEILVTSLLTQLFGSIILYLFLCFYFYINEYEYSKYLLLFSLSLIFKASDVVRYYYEYKLQMKKAVIIDSLILLVSGLLKIYAVTVDGTLLFFILIAIVEYILAAFFLLYRLLKDVKLFLNDFKISLATKLIIKGAPLIVSSMSIMLLMKVDTIMIEHYIGLEAVGLYSSATKISESWFFLPAILAQSFGSKIYELKKINKHGILVEKLLGFSFLFSVFAALVVSFIAPYIIEIIYGPEYAASSIILSIHIWSGCFMFLSVISGRWLLAENLHATAMWRTLYGVVVNIILNIYLIPRFGVVGAAASTLIGFSIGSYIGNVLNKKTRPLFYMQTKAICYVFMPQKYKELLSVIRKLQS